MYLYINKYMFIYNYILHRKTGFKSQIITSFGHVILTFLILFPYCKMGIIIVFAYNNSLYQ